MRDPESPHETPFPARDQPLERGHLPFGAIDVALVLGLIAATIFGAALFIDLPRRSVGVVAAMIAAQNAISVAAVYLVVMRLRGASWADLGLRPAPPGWTGKAILIALACIPLVGAVNYATQLVAGGPFHNPQVDMLAPEGFSWRSMLVMLVMAGVVAPVVEEIIFRGMVYRWLRQRMGVMLAAVASGVAFSGVHGIPMLIPAIAVQGVVLALVFERSRSLWPPIIVHGVFNSVMVLLLYAALATGAGLE